MLRPKCLVNAVLALACLSILLPSRAAAGAVDKARNKKANATDQFFSSSEVPRIQIDISEQGLTTLRKYQWQFGRQSERENVLVNVREGQNIYTNVSLHLKGAAGSFRGVEQNPAMTLDFDKLVKGQHFHGLTKLSLNNSVQDPSFVSEQLCRELFLKAGVPTPRATHALVELNGRDLGLYVLIEGWDKRFLKHHFKNPGGNLYDGGFLKDVGDDLALNSGQKGRKQTDRIALAEAAKEPDLTNRLVRLEKVLDLDRFLTFVALDVMLWDWDGYAMNRNNWRLYHDLDKDRMVFMPHGMDQMFWNTKGSILPSIQGLVAKAVLEIPELRARYFNRVQELRRTVFQPEAMTNRVVQIASHFLPALKEKNPDGAKDQEKALKELCDSIMMRAQSLDEQLSHPIEPLKFDSNGLAHLRGWEARTDFGFPQLVQSGGSSPALEIGTDRGSSIGSWRTKVWLDKGRYQLQGRVKTEGIVADPGDPRGGAGFRLDRRPPEKYALGNVDWNPAELEFSVDDLLREVQVICDFRGMEGKAWFDLASLRLRKLDSKP